jgi:hypothetical protein
VKIEDKNIPSYYLAFFLNNDQRNDFLKSLKISVSTTIIFLIMAQSSIEWTEMTWNPTTGCNKISAGCKYCYAEVMTRRLLAMGIEKYKNGFKVAVH